MNAFETTEASGSSDARLRVGVVCDFREEGWTSMELVADMLLSHLRDDHSRFVDATRIQPAMKMRFAKLRQPGSNGHSAHGEPPNGTGFNTDRVLNRFWDYPRRLRLLTTQFDLFHVIDHSYGQVVHALPSAKTVVTCHDLDTFRCLLNPESEPRSAMFKKMVRHTLTGFRKAARVTCDSEATRNELVACGLIDPDRTVVIPNGVHETCSPNPDPSADAEADRLLGSTDSVDVLHVGSTIPRKRIDILLRVFARVSDKFPNARLIRVGGAFTAEQARLARELNVMQSVVQLSQLDRPSLAAVYRRAAIVLLTSEREGFGLPVVEALACGTLVVASDLPVLREVGGDAAVYCRMGDVESWSEKISALLREREVNREAWAQRSAAGLAQASRFTWTEYTRKTVEVYRSVLAQPKV